MPGNRKPVIYTTHPCWWCGARLATEGQRVLIDLAGNSLRVHGRTCYGEALKEITPITARANLWPFLD